MVAAARPSRAGDCRCRACSARSSWWIRCCRARRRARRATSRVVAAARGADADPDREPAARAASTATGRSAARPGKGVRVCILDSGVERGHPRVGEVSGAVAITVGRGRRDGRDGRVEGDVCGHGTACAGDRPRARARGRDPLGARARRRVHRLGRGAARRSALGGRAGLRRHQHEPLDDEARSSARLLHELADTAYFKRTVLVASAHNMPVESFPWRFSSVDLGREPRGGRPARLLREPRAAGRVLRARRRRRGRAGSAAGRSARPATASRRRASPASRRSSCRKHPDADAVPAEERALPDRDERGGGTMTDDDGCTRRSPPGVLGSEDGVRAAAALDRRGRAGDLRREGVVDLPARRGDRRARLRRGRRRGGAGPRRQAHAVVDRHRRLGASSRHAARARGRAARPALRARRRRGDRLRAERA